MAIPIDPAGPVLVDADVWVDYLRGNPLATEFVEARADGIVLSPIVIAELYAGVKEDEEREDLDNLISLFEVLPVTAEIAKAAGLMKRHFGPSHGLSLADAILAATAQSAGAELSTLNVKHYPMLRGIRPAYTKK